MPPKPIAACGSGYTNERHQH
ncbi:hypothetical protein EMIT048CA2_120001 [Pseudomonas chlororaphis]